MATTVYGQGVYGGGLYGGGETSTVPFLFFEPPTYEEGPAARGDGLFHRVKLTRGITILKKDGAYTQYRYVWAGDIEAADITYLGGHIYQITPEEAADLTAAGYGAYIVTNDIPIPPSTGFGSGSYGAGVYGG